MLPEKAMIIVRVGFARLAVTFSLRDYTVAPRGVFGSSESGSAITENVSEVIEILREKRPQNVPQLYANQALHARYALHARIFLPSDFVSIENKERVIQIPKLKVASSSLVARSTFPQ